MAEKSVTLAGIVKMVLQDNGVLELKSRLDKLDKKLDETKKKMGGLGDAGKQVGQYLAGAFALGTIAAFVKSSITEFAKLERGFNAIGFQMQRLGLDAKGSLPEIKAGLQAIQDSGGPLVSETIPIFQKFIGITKDTDAALYATKLAADISEAGFMEAGAAGAALAAIMQGKAKQAAQALGIELVKSNGQTKTNAELMDEAIKTYFGLGDAIDDTQNQADTLNGVWASTKATVGEALAPALTWVLNAVQWLTKAVKSLAVGFGGAVDLIVTQTMDMAAVWGEVFNLKRLFTEGPSAYLSRISGAVDDWKRHFVTTLAGIGEQATEIWADTGEKSAIVEEDARKKIIDQARLAAKAADDKEAAEAAKREAERARKAAELRLRSEIEVLERRLGLERKFSDNALAIEKQLIAKRAELERMGAEGNALALASIQEAERLDTEAKEKTYAAARKERALNLEIAMLEGQLAVTKNNTLERLQLELDLLAKKHEAAIAAAEASGDDTAVIDEKFRAEWLERWLNGLERLGEHWRQTMAAINEWDLELLGENSREGLRIREQQIQDEKKRRIKAGWDTAKAEQWATRETTQLKRQAMAAEAARIAELGNIAIGSLTTIFGEHKAFAIAQAIINTWEGATKALSQGGIFGPALAAIVIAAGLKQVAEIRKTNPGGGGKSGKRGFDNPEHDRLAFLAGEEGNRRWAGDMVRNWQLGAVAGWGKGLREAIASGVGNAATYDQRQTYNRGGDVYNVYAYQAGDRQLRQLMRRARLVERRDQARRIG
ncbi:MAG TPA: hypothetical protein PKK95_09205 [Vicinamibacterales bacterium]|nr:hypothetical protein [Vicinamibacterales bacterium]